MRLTTKSRYGTRLIIDLAKNANNGPVSLGEISQRQGISLKYLEKLIKMLKQAGIVNSKRGPFGGYSLARPTSDISIGDIVRVLEGTESITDCSEKEIGCKGCDKSRSCAAQEVWIKASEAMFKTLDSFKVESLMS